MSFKDERDGEIDTARWQYNDLMGMLRSVNPGDPYSLLPKGLEQAVRGYESAGFFDIANRSCALREKLRGGWNWVKVPDAPKPDLEKIAKRSIFDDGMWAVRPKY